MLIPLALALPCLVPGLVLGRSAPDSRRPLYALWWAVVLNVLALAAPLAGYLAYLLIPGICFGIAAWVGGVAGRRAWLRGLLSCPWFLVPWVVWWALTASPDQVAAYGRVPAAFLMLSLSSGALGASAAEAMLFLHSRFWPGRDSA